MGLLDALKQYVSDAMPGGLLSPEWSQDNRKKLAAELQKGLLNSTGINARDKRRVWNKEQLDAVAGSSDTRASLNKESYETAMNMAGMAPMGMVAWHGSPHKFDKFSLDKIGTGEGAQAYGHGLYLAESPEVAKSYQAVLGGTDRQYYLGGRQVDPRMMDAFESNAISHLAYGKTPDQAIADLENQGVGAPALKKMRALLDDFHKQGVKMVEVPKENSSLYKTDIPDEAVARFLDWDKPLSQQSKEVQAAITASNHPMAKYWASKSSENPAYNGEDLYTRLGGYGTKEDATNLLSQMGVNGIRYLDGGSRSAGKGSSNFVVFDPEMIRILERNGQPTGQVPWQPGEYGLLK